MLSGLLIVTLGEVALMPGYVRKIQLQLTKKIATEVFKLSSETQLHFYLFCKCGRDRNSGLDRIAVGR